MNGPNYSFHCDKFLNLEMNWASYIVYINVNYDSDDSNSCGHIAQNMLYHGPHLCAV